MKLECKNKEHLSNMRWNEIESKNLKDIKKFKGMLQ
jgi:hypothetical protein